ncbi:hypothetical protein BDF19DRAFT_430428 [Syncephalis fuscata]|nr:hypothetical protein BDF19DRAFT_430428 [Syncephalis fuscata]
MSDLEEDTNKASYQAKRKTAHDIILINDTDEDYEDGHSDSVPTQSGYSLDGDSLVQEIIAANKEYGAPDEWQEVFIRLLALFNEQHVSACLEDVAIVIKRCIGRKLPENIKSSLDTFLDAGMYALYPRVVGLSGYALLAEMAKLWRRFHSQIITYLCAAFRGLRHIPMRDLLLSKFRDQIFIHWQQKLKDSNRRKQDAASLIQMCGLLLNASRHSPHGPDMVAIWRRLIAQWRSVNTRELPQPATAYV